MYGGSGVSPAGSPVSRSRQRPSPRCSSSSTGPYVRPGAEPPGRPREPLPEVAAEPLEQQHLAARPLDPDPGRHDARVVDDDERAAGLLGQVGERAVADRAGRPLVDEQARGVAPGGRVLGDQLRRQVVVELGRFHPTSTLPLLSVDEDAIERARERLQAAAEGRAEPGAVEAALERARDQIEGLAQAAAELSGLAARPRSASPSRRGCAAR